MTISLNQHFHDGGIDFTFAGDQPAFPLSSEAAAKSPPALRTLETLWFDERTVPIDGGYRLPFESVYELDAAEAHTLGIPPRVEPVEVELRSHGFPGGRSFAITAEVKDALGTEIPSESRQGPLLIRNGVKTLLPAGVAELLRLIDSGPPANLADHLLYLGEIKKSAARAGAQLDGFLEAQDIITPDGVGVEVDIDSPEQVRLKPRIEGVEGEIPGLESGATRRAYFRIDGERRTRVVLDESDIELADQVKERAEITGADVAKFFDNPEAYLPDGVDLSRFSLRVRGIVPRRYNSQPYVRLQPSEKRDWFSLDVDVELASSDELWQLPSDLGSHDSDVDPASDLSRIIQPETEADRPPHISPDEYAALCTEALDRGDGYVLHDGSWIQIDPEQAENYLKAWNHSEVDDQGVRGLRREMAGFILDVITNTEVLEYEEGASPQDFLEELPHYDLPESLVATLMPHQRTGYSWMRYLLQEGHGGLLADDMGLGKTVQVISLLAHLADAGQLQPALIVVPNSLVENWQREIARFCPRIRKVYVHQGGARLRRPEMLSQMEVVITTYGTLRRDQLMLGQIDWSVVICDEAQKVKNPTAQATSAVKGMKAKLRLAMTGTPVENGLSELWCIVDWVQPGKLGSQKEFREGYERPIQQAQGEGRVDLAFRLQHELTPHYLRRVKQDVLTNLPSCKPSRTTVGMGARQQSLYAGIIRQVQNGEMIPIEALQHLIAIASHPELYANSGRDTAALIDECPKLQAVLDIVEAIHAKGEKVVIFTRFIRMQQILQDVLMDRFAIHAPILNGKVAGNRRQPLVDRFNDAPGFGVMILSPEAAGVGLNITGANHVIHYTRLWNPAKENQATDRVHRMGQTRNVTVHYPIVGDADAVTVEVRLDELLAEKQALARDIVRPREGLSVERELFDIFETETAAA